VCLHRCFSSALDGNEWSGSRPARFNPREKFRYPFDVALGVQNFSRNNRQLGRQRNSCDYEMNRKVIVYRDVKWLKVDQGRVHCCWAVVYTVMNLMISVKGGEYVDQPRGCQLLKKG